MKSPENQKTDLRYICRFLVLGQKKGYTLQSGISEAATDLSKSMWYKDLYDQTENLVILASQRGNEIKASNFHSLVHQMQTFLEWVMRYPAYLKWTNSRNQPFNLVITNLQIAKKTLQGLRKKIIK